MLGMTVKSTNNDNSKEYLELSVIVPTYDEGENIDALLDRLEPALSKLAIAYEIIFVDDGSTDNTVETVRARRRSNSRICLIELSRNFGKENAITAGFDFSKGDAVICMDADLQHPPELIETLIGLWREGFEVVYTRRKTRNDGTWLRGILGKAFYHIYNKLSDAPIPPDAGDFRLLDRSVVQALCRLRETSRFMKGLYSWVGFRQIGVEFVPEERHKGKSTWNLWSLWNYAVEGITSFGTIPLRIWTYVGSLIALLSFVYAIFLVVRTIVWGADVPGFASLIVLVLFFGGIQLITLGIFGEYLGRVYQEAKGRPLYIVSKQEGLKDRIDAQG